MVHRAKYTGAGAHLFLTAQKCRPVADTRWRSD